MIPPHLLPEHLRILRLEKEWGLKETNPSETTTLSKAGKKVFTAIRKEIQESEPIKRESVILKIRREWHSRTQRLDPKEKEGLRKELNEHIPRLKI